MINIFYHFKFYFSPEYIFCSTKFENFLLCERILITVPLRSSLNKKILYSTRSCANWAFFGTRGPLKRSFHSRFKLAHSCQRKSNLHTNSLNKLHTYYYHSSVLQNTKIFVLLKDYIHIYYFL
jgi:hypothetical protein